MLDDRGRRAPGRIQPGVTTIVEPTSGNTGIALAWVAAAKGYRLILTMPESMSLERRVLLLGYGAELVLTPAAEGMIGAINVAEQIVAETPNAWMPQQFENPANPEIHRRTTAVEIWEDTDGKVDILVGGIGTGGTITGAGQVLKQLKPDLKSIAVEPAESPSSRDGQAGSTQDPGNRRQLRAGCPRPAIFTTRSSTSTRRRAIAAAHELMANRRAAERDLLRRRGAAAREVAGGPRIAGKLIVVVLPDTGERYLSTVAFAELRDRAAAMSAG